MKINILLIFLLLCLCHTAFGQELTEAQKAAAAAAKAITEAPKPEAEKSKTNYWKVRSVRTDVKFSQQSLTNWAAGGDNTVTMKGYVDANANWKKNQMFWNNRLQLNYGFLYASSKPILQKSEDKIYFESTWGYQAYKKLYLSANYNFKSQFSTGYSYSTPSDIEGLKGNALIQAWKDARVVKSDFLSPANTNLALGINWTASKWLTVNFAPLTGGFVIVTNPILRSKYSMTLTDEFADMKEKYSGLDKAPPGEEAAFERYNNGMSDGTAYKSSRFEFGAQMKMDVKLNVNNNFKYNSQILLFSNYLKNPQNIRVNWDNRFDWKLTKFFSLSFTTGLIYDDTIMIFSEKDGLTHQRVQFKQSTEIGFTWTFNK